jgi:FkbM family methyltransferase
VLIPMETVMGIWSPRHPPRIMHVGAHMAEERDAYETAGADYCWWVEANADLIPALRERLTAPRQLVKPTAHMVAHALVGKHDGTPATLHVAAETMCSSVFDMGSQEGEYVRDDPMTTVTVDRLAGEFGQPTMLNIDVQGAELDVLKGGRETLRGVELVYVEVAEEETYVGAPHRSQIEAVLQKAGLRLMLLEMDRNNAGWGDAVFRRQGIG